METVQSPENKLTSKSQHDSQDECDTTKVFISGNSQAVRLPKAYRFAADVDTLEIKKVGNSIVLTPTSSLENSWAKRVNDVFNTLAEANAESGNTLIMDIEDLPQPEREAIDFHKDWTR